MSSEIDPTLIQEIVKEMVIDNYILYATLTVLIYDLAASFELEIKYIWRRHISAVAALYITTRYGAILCTTVRLLTNTFDASNGICRLTYFFAIIDIIIMFCVDYILLLRVRALYSRGKAISIVLFFAFGTEVIAVIVFAIQGVLIEDKSHRSYVQQKVTIALISVKAIGIAPGLSLCIENDPPIFEGPLSWSIPLAYGTLLLVLALYKAAAIWKEVGLNGISLVKVLIRDQALYFLAVIFVCVANIVADVVDFFSLLSNVFQVAGNPASLSILGAHLLFNMKEAGEKGLNQGTSCPTRSTVSEIDFAAPPAGAVESSLGEATGAEEVLRAVEAEIEEIV